MRRMCQSRSKSGSLIQCGRPKLRGGSTSFHRNAPLWFYILAESQHDWLERTKAMPPDQRDTAPTRLGKVGGRIVAEVLIGLALGDSHSFLSLNPGWRPLFGRSGAPSVFDIFSVGDLVDALPPVKESGGQA